MRNWYIKVKDNPTITWFKTRLFRLDHWLDLKAYIQEVVGVTTVPSHTHNIADVTSLQTTLDGKVDENVAIVGATKTKITYDVKGLVTAGADATTADIADSTNKRYVTDAQLVVITNTSGTNTGDQTLSHSSDATSHTVTLSASGGSLKLIEGSNITLTTSSNEVTIAASSSGGGLEQYQVRRMTRR